VVKENVCFLSSKHSRLLNTYFGTQNSFRHLLFSEHLPNSGPNLFSSLFLLASLDLGPLAAPATAAGDDSM
jgi:hypothetical protein